MKEERTWEGARTWKGERTRYRKRSCLTHTKLQSTNSSCWSGGGGDEWREEVEGESKSVCARSPNARVNEEYGYEWWVGEFGSDASPSPLISTTYRRRTRRVAIVTYKKYGVDIRLMRCVRGWMRREVAMIRSIQSVIYEIKCCDWWEIIT